MKNKTVFASEPEGVKYLQARGWKIARSLSDETSLQHPDMPFREAHVRLDKKNWTIQHTSLPVLTGIVGLPGKFQVFKGPGGYQITDGDETVHVISRYMLEREIGQRIVAKLDQLGHLD